MDVIIVADKNSSVIYRISDLMKEENVKIIGAKTSGELYSELRINDEDVKMIVIDVEFDKINGFELINKVKGEYPYLGVMILTSLNKKEDFVKGIKVGAIDYMLKPFDDIDLKERMFKHINNIKHKKDEFQKKNINKKEFEAVDFETYLRSEIKKAKKGNYEVTISMIMYFKPVKVVSQVLEKEYMAYSDVIYNLFKKELWDTDMILHYGYQSYLMIMPFCGKKQVSRVKDKIKRQFQDLKREKLRIADYKIVQSFVTFPGTVESPSQIIDKLVQEAHRKMEEATK